MEPTYNPVDQTFIAARVPTAFKERIEQFSTMNDISVSQLILSVVKTFGTVEGII